MKSIEDAALDLRVRARCFVASRGTCLEERECALLKIAAIAYDLACSCDEAATADLERSNQEALDERDRDVCESEDRRAALDPSNLDRLADRLKEAGLEVIGPSDWEDVPSTNPRRT